MYRFMRTATIRTAALVPNALAFASQVTAHVNQRHHVAMRFGVEQYGSPRLHWHFDAESLDTMQKMNAALLEDREYLALLDKYKDCWIDGQMQDTLVRMA